MPEDTDRAVAELCDELFAGLPRKDQRRRGVEYVHGLLRTPGRKSIRNIAGQANEQRLHHFVSDSTWDWMPVRRALRTHLLRSAPPLAWVVRSMMIPKTGEHTVGVGRRYCRARGSFLSAQHAIGLWAAAPGWTSPVHWRLHLSATWLGDADRCRRAAIPAGTVPQPVDECLVDTYLELAADRDLPVVLDARDVDAPAVVRRLRAAGAPVLARIDATTPLCPDPPVPGHADGPLPAARLLAMVRHTRRPVFGAGAALAATGAVRLPGPGRSDGLVLLGVGRPGPRWPDEVWLSTLTGHSLADLVRLARLPGRVYTDLAGIGDRVGLRDFTGRSFAGWHRHVTLASAAHALVALHGAAPYELREAG
ncbi:transposase [Dactylosporangium fulvum]|uniref:Transposase n=1 Tax=Dactylosporangium fulvum TaxID=53359 RepID=A0ABY5WAR1_9ACTN|nr:transposase [Dactylosporangium fulvum]UWP87145.1 transposase [Dactylosporangium fulvum]